jgi:Tfp pilus assembly protein PilN
MKAAQKQKKDNQINLLPRDKFAASSLGRILGWLLSTFRIIVIMVEMIVMIAFLSRFWLDARNSDLNDEIDQKKALIAASKDFEAEFRNTQRQLKIFTELTKEEHPHSKYLSIISPLIPSEIVLDSFIVQTTGISATGLSPSEQAIAQFITNLEANGAVENVYLTKLGPSKDDENLLEFNLEMTIKKEK